MSSKHQRIESEVSDKVFQVKKIIKIKELGDLNFSQTVGFLVDEYLKKYNFKKETDITEQYLRINDSILSKYRISTNLNPELKQQIKIIQKVLNSYKTQTEKKLTLEETLQIVVQKYFDAYPNMINEFKALYQQIKLQELKDKMSGQ